MRYSELNLLRDDLVHLPVTPENVQACVDNPNVTYQDLEALYWSVSNTPEGLASPLIPLIENRMSDLILGETDV